MDVAKQLSDLKAKIEGAKKNRTLAQGRKQELMKQLKSSFQVTTVKAAKTKLEQIETRIDRLEEKRDKDLAELEANYDI